MAPSPENDNEPKAPDKKRVESASAVEAKPTTELLAENSASTAGTSAKDSSLSTLDDDQLKALLDEALDYKCPKDREGKSKIFKKLLQEAEEDERNARAASASGSTLVRYYNTTASRRHRHNKRERPSVSENLTHGGSLQNLAQAELFEAVGGGGLHGQRARKTVSARQREGGSLPCNVNAGQYDRQFFDEARRRHKNKPQTVAVEYTAIDMEAESLLEHDSLNRDLEEEEDVQQEDVHQQKQIKYTSRATLEVTGVDDALSIPSLEQAVPDTDTRNGDKSSTMPENFARIYQSNYSLLNIPRNSWVANISPYFGMRADDKKFDENGNALGGPNGTGSTTGGSGDGKKKKKRIDRNVVVQISDQVEGHRADIIQDIEKLVQFIENGDQGDRAAGGGGGAGAQQKSKAKLQKNVSSKSHEEDKTKKRTRSKVKTDVVKKSNSLEEISKSKLEDLTDLGSGATSGGHVNNIGSNDLQPQSLTGGAAATGAARTRPERRSWGNSDDGTAVMSSSATSGVVNSTTTTSLYCNASAENLESDFRVVTKKKKSRKRSGASGGRQQGYYKGGRAPSPERRRSVPPSEKSNDSSDVDSVHSLPVEASGRSSQGFSQVVSYADIARASSSATSSSSSTQSSRHADAFPLLPQTQQQQQTTTTTTTTHRHVNNNSNCNNNNNINNSSATTNSNKCNNNTLASNTNTTTSSLDVSVGSVGSVNSRDSTSSSLAVTASAVVTANGGTVLSGGGSAGGGARPAVVILSETPQTERAADVVGLTFGFELNEQLLSDSASEAFTARYVAPVTLHNYNHDKIVTFVGLAWEDVIQQSHGQVQYYSGQ